MSALHTTRIEWRGIGIQLEFHANRWNSPVDHIEIRSDNRVPLPITETGYKSHFISAGQVKPETLVEATPLILYKRPMALIRPWLPARSVHPQ